jgi:hypothetical protein
MVTLLQTLDLSRPGAWVLHKPHNLIKETDDTKDRQRFENIPKYSNLFEY